MKYCYIIPKEKILFPNLKSRNPDTNTQETNYFLTHVLNNCLFD